MENLNLEILKTLECPCCLEYMTDRIYECNSGHSVCNSCLNFKVCPICQSTFTDTRNFSLEAIGKLVYYPCSNENRGCRHFCKLEELNDHLQFCNYRNYTCKLDKNCSWEGRRSELKKHYLDKHANNVLIGDECICLWKPDNPEYEVSLLLAFKERFYIHRKIKNGTMYWAVQYIGRTEDVILFYFELHIFTDQFSDRKIEFSEICHDDIKNDIDEIIDTGFCVGVPLALLETYFDTQGVIYYRIKIKRA